MTRLLYGFAAAPGAASGLERVFSQGDNKETVDARRRRQGTSGGPQSGRRAEAPQRRRPRTGGTGSSGGSGGTGGSGGSGGSGGLGGFGGGDTGGAGGAGKRMPIGVAILFFIIYLAYTVLTGGGDEPAGVPADIEAPPAASRPTSIQQSTVARPAATATLRPAVPAASGDTTWTVMLYQDADDKILEQDIYLDLNEAERIGSSQRVNIVAQVDRFRGGYQGDGDWTGTRRYYIRQDNNLQRLGSDLVEEMGEADMAEGQTLVDFVRWSVENYPADRYALILSDHGTGWPGGWSDPDPGGSQRSNIPIVSRLDDNLFLMEIDEALESARQAAGIDKFELIGMDACLMGHIEVFAALEPHARYAVASQETEPALGWAYTSFLEALVQNPNLDGGQLGHQIVDTYIEGDQRIVDNDARAEFLRQGSPLGGLFSASAMSAPQLAAQLGRDITLTAVDLSALPGLMENVNTLAVRLQDEDQSVVSSARNYSQSFTNIFSRSGPAPYIDLGHFAQLIAREGRERGTVQAAQGVLDGLGRLIVSERHGPGKPGATGVSIYFPNGTLYSTPVSGPQSYTAVANRFAVGSLWDDFLAYHYHDMPIRAEERSAVAPQGPPSRAPGVGQIDVSLFSLSADTAAPGQPVTVTAEISGENIGYIYLFVGYYDAGSNSIFVADTDYLESPETRELNGIYYPVWIENEPFDLRFEWEPTVFEIQNGDQRVTALFMPQQYGASAEDTVYTVDGVYTYADGEQRRARLYFQDGALRQVFGFAGSEEAAAPWEITPESGDAFTILDTWIELDDAGRPRGTVYEEGETLVFEDDMFRLGEVFAAEGDYIIGLIVEDLEGLRRQVYAEITVQ